MAKYKPKPWLVCCLILVGLLCAVALVCLCVVSLLEKKYPEGTFTHAAVSADSRPCSEIGRDILKKGGSAVDGAIAALLCTSVVNPHSMGIGGGSIVTIRNKNGNVTVYNFRETVPQTFKRNLLKDCPKKKMGLITGPQWIGVPGELRGYEAMHKHYGKLPWAKLFEPTIRLAKEGIPMPQFLGKILKYPLLKSHVESTSICEVFCDKNNTVLRLGDTLKFPKLAETMETIAEQGAEAFYTGKIGHALIQDIKAAGGTLTMADLKSFKVRESAAWTVPLGHIQMHIPPPPAGGALLAFILELMTEFPLSPNTLDSDHEKILMYHRYIEANKFANGQKRSIRDPAFDNGKSADHLIDPSFIQRIKGMIMSNRTHDNAYYFNTKPSRDHVGTTHVSVLDEDGLAVSATSTINHLFGGGIYSRQTGIILNNELSDFCDRADTVRPGEQPPSSMTPVILENTKSGGLLVIGGSGGSMITSAVALSIINRVWLGMKLKDAIDARIVFVDSNNNVNFEPKFDKTVKDGLVARGHVPGNMPYYFNVVNAVEKENGFIVAVSDGRKIGMSAGY
ncbi:glutathione hydrolase 5 proenzyme [Centropristis striata]|uniref:glutathione hydrolase 5 proenzyme n=1 Tax=Centropristis striata TaxID=184440 RepID=UPI0027E1FF02|nr:glutathione hydrolase 5 proenzyme [Centropristis striata]